MTLPLRLKRPLCLASASPRRRELLAQYGLEFSVNAVDIDETPRAGEGPEALVARLAREKAEAAAHQMPAHLVLAGDTLVVQDDAVLGKPGSPAEARAMLARLADREHRVLTGYHLLDGLSGPCWSRTVETRVTFRPLPAAWLDWYAAHPEAQDKAGAYGIQGLGGLMVARLEGSYTNVVGLPVESVVWDLLEHGWLELT